MIWIENFNPSLAAINQLIAKGTIIPPPSNIMAVGQVADPSVTDINQLQEKYIAAVNNLFEESLENT